jgi:AAA15 family ATPase/GTPase
MSAASIKDFPQAVYSVYSTQNPRILKTACLIGANAVGKSNLLKAIDAFSSLITGKAELNQVAVPFKLVGGYSEKPIHFEIVFLLDNQRFRYGVSILSNRIHEEYLYLSFSSKEESVFLRSSNSFVFGNKIKKDLGGKLALLSEMTRNDNLFLSVLSKYNYGLAIEIEHWFSRVLFFRDSEVENWIQFTARLMAEDSWIHNAINNFIKQTDIGIDQLVERKSTSFRESNFSISFLNLIESLSSRELEIDSVHRRYSADLLSFEKSNEIFNLILDESSGTIKLVSLIGPLLYAIKNRYVLLVDELDSRLHSILLKHLYDFFANNSHAVVGSQIVFTMHNAFLLKKSLRRDQIILFEKDQFGGTSFQSLHQKNPKVRNDASIEKDYLEGKYSAIPRIGEQLDLEF